ncbi:NHL repeat-containing protein [Thalassospira australica]|uniref:NHL repeat-containing protein n=1 Tax=Thalassospira australica TaxID=1528106 RepID=UPI00138E4150|nr:NHL repeat-containing protein [Thalassospira australica]
MAVSPKMYKDVSSGITRISGFSRPFGFDLDCEGRLYVADMGLHCIFRFDKDLAMVQCLDGVRGWSNSIEVVAGHIAPRRSCMPMYFNGPHSVAVGGDGKIFVTTYYEAGVFVLSSAGRLITTLGRGYDSGPRLAGPATGVLTSERTLCVTEYSLNAVFRYDVHGMVFEGALGGGKPGFRDVGSCSTGGGPCAFDRPHMCKSDADGDLVVVDTWNHRLQKFTPGGQFIGCLGSSSSGWSENSGDVQSTTIHGGFNAPVAVSFDDFGRFVVTDWGNNRLLWFNSGGQVTSIEDELDLETPYDAQVFSGRCVIANSRRGEVLIKSAIGND